jgi:hypothetical protein
MGSADGAAMTEAKKTPRPVVRVVEKYIIDNS